MGRGVLYLCVESTMRNLALAVYRNEGGAMEEMVRAHQDEIYTYAVRLLGDHWDAQEVTQDTFVKAHGALSEKYSEDRCRSLALRPWLFRIAHHVASNRRRAGRASLRRSRAASGLIDVVLAGPSPGPEDALVAREKHGRLAGAVLRLSRSDQELVVLRFVEEMTYADIAAVTGGTEACARAKVFRALRKLRELIKKNEESHAM